MSGNMKLGLKSAFQLHAIITAAHDPHRTELPNQSLIDQAWNQLRARASAGDIEAHTTLAQLHGHTAHGTKERS